MDNLHWWEVCFLEALIETDENMKLARVNAALAAIEERLFSPLEPRSDEDTKIRAALAGLARLKSEMCSGRVNQPPKIDDA